MSSENSDEDIMKNVFQLRERLMQTETSLHNINRLADMDNTVQDRQMSYSDPFDPPQNDSMNLPPPLTLDDLGELNSRDVTVYSPVDENVLREWNMNSGRSNGRNDKSFRRSVNRTMSEDFQLDAAPRNIHITSEKLVGPSTSSPNLMRYGKPGNRAFSCDDLTSAMDLGVDLYAADSYRMLKQPSFTSHVSMSAPISPRKITSHSGRRAPSPSHSDILDRHSRRFEQMHAVASDSSSLANFTLLASGRSNKSFSSQDDSGDLTLNETGKENVTPRKLTARSNETSLTVLGAEAESERMQGRLTILRDDNSRLNHLVSELRHQLETEKAQQASRYKLMFEKQEENILSLKEEAQANEKSLRNAENALDESEKARQKTSRTFTALKDEISHLNSLLSEAKVDQDRANSHQKEAFTDAQELARRLEVAQERLDSNEKRREEMETKLKKEIKNQERLRNETSEKAAKLQHANSQLHRDLRSALLQLEDKDNRSSKQTNEKIYISRALQDLQEQFAELRTDFLKKTTELQKASQDRAALQQRLDELSEQNRLRQDRLSSCQVELEDERAKVTQLEKDLQKSKQELSSRVYYGISTGNTDSGRGGSAAYGENREDESPRKQKATIAELKMKLASKEAQIQRLEARVNSFSMEAEKLEGIRGELINVVERSRLGDKRAHELEGIVHSLEDERSKVTRQFMEAEDMLNDKKAECESLETRLKDRTKYLTAIQNDFNESQITINKLNLELKKKSLEHQKLTEQLEEKTLECESRYAALQRAEEELAEKRRTLENAAEWTGKRESESRRELEKIKKIHKEQHEEMEKQIEMLQSERDRHRDQARELDCLVCQLRNENESCVQRLRTAESELEDVRISEQSSREKEQNALDALQNKCQESSSQVTALQQALDQCKTDIHQYVDQLEETSSKFKHQMAVKNSQVAKLESEFKIAQDSLRSENLHVTALQENLTERRKALQEASEKISSLQESETFVQSKLAKTELILDRERAKLNQEREQWESRLQSACHELDAKNRQFMQLNEALKGVDKEFNSCRMELASVEQQLSKLRKDAEEKTLKLEKSQADANNAKTQLVSKTEKIASLEEKVTALESTRKQLLDKCSSLEMELARHLADIQSYSQKSSQLQAALDSNHMDTTKKDTIISRLQIAFKEAKEQLTKSERKNEDLEGALEERQWELQQRATQLGNLEINLREHKCNAEKKLLELQGEFRKSQIELKERNSQVSKLDEQLTTYREDLSEVRHLLDEKDQDLRRLSREIEQKVERCHDLEKALNESRTAYEERHRTYLEVTQELRVTREQSQRSAQQWQGAQRELTRLQHQQHDLINDLKEMGQNEKQKEGHVSELTAKLTEALAQKNALEENYGGELERMRKDVLKLHQQHQDEIGKLRSRHAHELIDAKTQVGDRSVELRSALERENEMKREGEAVRELIMSLENELLARKQVIEAANDTIVVKEAEIARLEAKLSGTERVEKLKVMHTTPMKPLHSTVKPSKDRYNVEDDDHPDFLPSFLTQDLDHRKNLAKISPDPTRPTSTLFSGLDPDSGSLDPSFLNIASSPSKKPTADDLLIKDLTSSRASYLNNTNGYSDVDDSMFARVFKANNEIDTENLIPTPREDMAYTSDDRGQHNSMTSTSASMHFGLGSLRPDQCMADLQERLRASEQRRQQVTSKLRQLKSSKEST